MDIFFRTKKLAKLCTVSKTADKQLGMEQAKRLRRRLDDLRAAPSLEAMRPPFPGRCHELKGDRKGQLSLDLSHPYRLIFVPGVNPPPTKEDGGLDWAQVQSVEIVDIEDTHG